MAAPPITQSTKYRMNVFTGRLDRTTINVDELNISILHLLDTPDDYGTAGQVLKMNATLDGLEWGSGGSGGGNAIYIEEGSVPESDSSGGDLTLNFTDSDFNILTVGQESAISINDGGIDHNSTLNYDSDEHLDHTAISVIAGTLLTGGGTIDGNVTLNVDEASIDHDALTNYTADEHFTMLDEDNLGSDDDTQAATQQSIKAYVDNSIGSIVETDPLSVHVDGSTPLTSNWNAGSFRINAEAFFAELDMYINYDGPDGDSYLYFFDTSSMTGQYLMWDDSPGGFVLSSNLNVSDHLGVNTPFSGQYVITGQLDTTDTRGIVLEGSGYGYSTADTSSLFYGAFSTTNRSDTTNQNHRGMTLGVTNQVTVTATNPTASMWGIDIDMSDSAGIIRNNPGAAWKTARGAEIDTTLNGTDTSTASGNTTWLGYGCDIHSTVSPTFNMSSGGAYLYNYGVAATVTSLPTLTAGSAFSMYTYGGYFAATGNNVGTSIAYGIYATASGADTNYAGWFDGNVDVQGDLDVSGGITGINVTSGADPGHTHTSSSIGGPYVKTDGTTPLTASWNAGNYNIQAGSFLVDDIYIDYETVYSDSDLILSAADGVKIAPDSDLDDYIEFRTNSNVPGISTGGGCDLTINASSLYVTSGSFWHITQDDREPVLVVTNETDNSTAEGVYAVVKSGTANAFHAYCSTTATDFFYVNGKALYCGPNAVFANTITATTGIINTGLVVNETGYSTGDFRVESDIYTHMLFVDAGANRIGINESVPAYTLDITGNFGCTSHAYVQGNLYATGVIDGSNYATIDRQIIVNDAAGNYDSYFKSDAGNYMLFLDAYDSSVGGMGAYGCVRIGSSSSTYGNSCIDIKGYSWGILGPQMAFTADSYPAFYIMPWNHDNTALIFDGYYDGSWKSSDAGSNFMFRKISDRFRLQYDSSVGVTAAIGWNDAMVIDLDDGKVWMGTDTNMLGYEGTAVEMYASVTGNNKIAFVSNAYLTGGSMSTGFECVGGFRGECTGDNANETFYGWYGELQCDTGFTDGELIGIQSWVGLGTSCIADGFQAKGNVQTSKAATTWVGLHAYAVTADSGATLGRAYSCELEEQTVASTENYSLVSWGDVWMGSEIQGNRCCFDACRSGSFTGSTYLCLNNGVAMDSYYRGHIMPRDGSIVSISGQAYISSHSSNGTLYFRSYIYSGANTLKLQCSTSVTGTGYKRAYATATRDSYQFNQGDALKMYMLHSGGTWTAQYPSCVVDVYFDT